MSVTTNWIIQIIPQTCYLEKKLESMILVLILFLMVEVWKLQENLYFMIRQKKHLKIFGSMT